MNASNLDNENMQRINFLEEINIINTFNLYESDFKVAFKT